MSAAPPRARRSRAIARSLAAARRRLVGFEFARRLALASALALALAGALMLADWLFELPLGARRTTFWSGAALAVAALAWAFSALVTARRDDEEIALMVERREPAFDSRLISAIQFARGKAAVPAGAPSAMLHSVVEEAEGSTRRSTFTAVADPRGASRAALALLAVLAACGLGAFLGRGLLPVLVQRALGADLAIPRETRIVDSPGPMRVGVGDTVDLAFAAEGVLPAEAELEVSYQSGRDETLTMVQAGDRPGRYFAVLEDVPESFTFRARINDATTPPAEVTALPRPEVASLGARQTYPAFTGLPPSDHAPGDFALFPGGEAVFTLTASAPLAEAKLAFIDGGTELPLAIDPADPSRASAALRVPEEELGGFTIALRDRQGMESIDGSVYRVTLLSDLAPQVRITYPRRTEELVTRRARVRVAYEATDRFGVASANLRWLREDGSEGELALDVPGGAPKALEGELDWDLAETIEGGLEEGETLTYWIEAADQNASAANVGLSERLRLAVVTPEEKRADLLGRASDAIGNVGEATADQERLNRALEQLLRAAGGPDAAAPTPDE